MSAASMMREPQSLSSDFRMPGALEGESDLRELEHTSSARWPVVWAGVVWAGRIS